METIFWKTLEDEIGVGKLSEEDWQRVQYARTVGMMMRYEPRANTVVGLKHISEGDSSLKYLTAFIDISEWLED
jgi:hypothetical protein